MGEQTEQEATDQLTVDFGDTQGHAYVAPEDARRILEALGNKPDGDRLGIRFSLGDDDDVEGHSQTRFVTVLAGPLDDDTEGHAISLHFPTTHDADAFRRRLLATGVITGALIIGGVGIALQPAATGSLAAPQAGSVSRSAQVTQMQQAAQYQREQRLQNAAPGRCDERHPGSHRPRSRTAAAGAAGSGAGALGRGQDERRSSGRGSRDRRYAGGQPGAARRAHSLTASDPQTGDRSSGPRFFMPRAVSAPWEAAAASASAASVALPWVPAPAVSSCRRASRGLP